MVYRASSLHGDLALKYNFIKGQTRDYEHQCRAWPTRYSCSLEGHVRTSSQAGHARSPFEHCRCALDADRRDWPSDVHCVGVEVATSRRTRRRTRRECQALEVALPIAPMKGKGGLDRVERRGSRPALNKRGPRP